ncbi:MAG TPA: amino acid permease [Streptosporangiaceae bacterium]|nr:amino acid permease [Streptosporangiaceae bacterium]
MLYGIGKRLLVGTPMQSDRLGHTLLPKKIALPVFASDALSSVAYATEEILIVLSVGGLALVGATPWIALAVGLLMLVVVASYRQNVHAYPSGGGDYEVTTTNLGPKLGITVAAALMVDYTLTVAVSVSSGVANLASAFPALDGHVTLLTVIVVATIALLNLRGVRESGTAFAIPTYCFVATVTLLIVWGLIKLGTGGHIEAVSSHYHVQNVQDFTGFALVFLLLRAFSSGCTALTGVEAISNGVPSFKKPKSKNAATTLAMLGGIAVTMFGGITALAMIAHVHTAATPAELGLPPSHPLPTVIAQVGQAVFGHSSPFFYILQLFTALILMLAANTAFNGFPVLASILARDGYLPRQLRTRGDRLAYSNGILLLSAFAIVLIIAFDASPTRLIQLYIVGVFVSFTCSQTGMIRHWNRHLRTVTDRPTRMKMIRSRAINTVGACVTGVVLVIVVVSKFASGAWIAVAAMGVIWLTMRGIQRHYENVALELKPELEGPVTLPASNVSIVLVSKLHLPTLRALAYARATKPARLEAITVSVDEAETQRLLQEWEQSNMPLPLTVVSSPYRDITQPVIAYVKRLRLESPRDIVTVYIPEYVLGHWWEQVLHNQSALRLKARLLNLRGVVVASVPYQLKSAAAGSYAEKIDPLQQHREQAQQAEQAEHAGQAGGEPERRAREDGTPLGRAAAQKAVQEAAARDAARQAAAEQAAAEQAAAEEAAARQPAAGQAAAGQAPDGSDSPAPPDGDRRWSRLPMRLSLREKLTAGRDALQAAETRAESSQVGGDKAIPIADCRQREVVDVAGTLRAVTLRPRGNSLTMEADLWDGTGNITLVWLGRRDIPGIQPGRRIVVHGRLATIKGEPTIFNPTYELRPAATEG